MQKGILFIISAPSGAGKTTLLKKLMADLSDLVFSVSHTTRSPRAGERDGEDYFFVDHATFVALRDDPAGGFLEWAEVHGNLYGTGRAAVEQRLAAGLDVVLDIDVQGATQVRGKRRGVSIFIMPPSVEELTRRLQGRGTDDDEVVALRLAGARMEIEFRDNYDYLVVNDDLETAVAMLCAIILAERARSRRDAQGQALALDW